MESFKKISEIENHLKALEKANDGLSIASSFDTQRFVINLFNQANKMNLNKNMNDFERSTNATIWKVIKLDDIQVIKDIFNNYFSQFSTVHKDIELFSELRLLLEYTHSDKAKKAVPELQAKGFEIINPSVKSNRDEPILVTLDLSKKKLKFHTHTYAYKQTEALRYFTGDNSIEINNYKPHSIDSLQGTITQFQNGNFELEHKYMKALKEKLYTVAANKFNDCILAIKK